MPEPWRGFSELEAPYPAINNQSNVYKSSAVCSTHYGSIFVRITVAPLI